MNAKVVQHLVLILYHLDKIDIPNGVACNIIIRYRDFEHLVVLHFRSYLIHNIFEDQDSCLQGFLNLC